MMKSRSVGDVVKSECVSIGCHMSIQVAWSTRPVGRVKSHPSCVERKEKKIGTR